ncbi:hypothetical protein HKD37_18G049606 [Glycine soja]
MTSMDWNTFMSNEVIMSPRRENMDDGSQSFFYQPHLLHGAEPNDTGLRKDNAKNMGDDDIDMQPQSNNPDFSSYFMTDESTNFLNWARRVGNEHERLVRTIERKLNVECDFHNHKVISTILGHSYTEKTVINQLIKNMVKLSQILLIIKDQTNVNIIKTIYNEHQKYLVNKRVDNENVIKDILWALLDFIKLLNSFPIVLICDTIYKTSLYHLSLLEIVGITSTNMTFVVAFVKGLFVKVDLLPKAIVNDMDLVFMNALEIRVDEMNMIVGSSRTLGVTCKVGHDNKKTKMDHYMDEFSYELQQYILNVVNVTPDENCVLAVKWMTIPNMRHVVTSQYNVVLVYLSRLQNCVFFPLRSPAPFASHLIAIEFLPQSKPTLNPTHSCIREYHSLCTATTPQPFFVQCSTLTTSKYAASLSHHHLILPKHTSARNLCHAHQARGFLFKMYVTTDLK